jgi:hypothetical protein
MQRMLSRLSAVMTALALVVCQAGCQNPKPLARAQWIKTLSPSARPANTGGLSVQEINNGAKLLIAKCARCHPLYDPSPYTDAEWSQWMTKMTKKVRLKPEQEELLWRYLEAFRAPR